MGDYRLHDERHDAPVDYQLVKLEESLRGGGGVRDASFFRPIWRCQSCGHDAPGTLRDCEGAKSPLDRYCLRCGMVHYWLKTRPGEGEWAAVLQWVRTDREGQG